MKRIIQILIVVAIIFTITSCGDKPGGLRKLDEMVPEFCDRLNEACQTSEYNDLLKLFDDDCKIMLQTDFNPEVHQGISGARGYFGNLRIDTKFQIGEVTISGLDAVTQYSYMQENGASGTGTWQFRINNMGKIKEMTIFPGE